MKPENIDYDKIIIRALFLVLKILQNDVNYFESRGVPGKPAYYLMAIV